jgi:hypothetical protein
MKIIEIKHEEVIATIPVNRVDFDYAMALADTFEPVAVEDITPKTVTVGAYAFASDFERANLRLAQRNTYGLQM